MEELDKQEENKPARDEKGRLLPGNTANPAGRPKGKTMKEFAKEYLLNKTDEEKKAWIEENINKLDIWKMAEGMPKQDTEVALDVKAKIISIDE